VSIDYKTSDGKTFTCAGCQNCTDQAENLQNYCSMPQGMSSCSTPVACGSTGMTYKECTTTGSGGACEGIEYELSGGQTFACASCADCNSAVSQLNAACSGSGNPTTACTSWAACSTSTLQYKECTTSVNGACQGIYYQTSDGQQYTCNSCSDCSSAISSMESYCQSMAQPVTSCGTSYTCGSTGVTYQECETTQSGACTAEYFTTSDGQQFNCSGCSCSSAQTSLNSYCSSLGSFTCGTTTCTSGSLCCTCSGVQGCYSSNGGTYTCATYGCQ